MVGYDPLVTSRNLSILPESAQRRGRIITALMNAGTLSRETLWRSIGIEEKTASDWLNGLSHLVKSGIVLEVSADHYSIDENATLRVGVISRAARGKLVMKADSHEEYALASRQARRILPGDRVLCTLRRGRGRANSGIVVLAVLVPSEEQVLGRFEGSTGGGWVRPEERYESGDLFIDQKDTLGARANEMVLVKRLSHPFYQQQMLGRITRRLQDAGAVTLLIERLAQQQGLSTVPCVLDPARVDALERKLSQGQGTHRLDMTGTPFVTIDGETAKDFDDALYCEFKNDRFRLDVAIADVSYWVEAESALDLDARDRGNSFYLANSVFPMLPERLSNDLCSLRPNEDRFAFVCRMEISPMGDILSSEFVEATICSAARLTYPQVTRFLSGDHEGTEDGPPEVLTNLEALAQVAELLLAKRQREGSVDFEFPEAKIRYREDGWIDNCWSEPRGRSTQIVEEAMLAANVCAAELLGSEPEAPGIYRVHDAPDAQDIAGLRRILSLFGVPLGGGKSPAGADLSACLRALRKKGDGYRGVEMLILRCMSQARYTAQSHGHFALGFAVYTHFTSPIRRYPDLVVHRLLKSRLGLGGGESFGSGAAMLEGIAAHCSKTERMAEEIERAIMASLKAEFMHHRLGESFEGVISSVTPFGVFVTLKGMPIDGLVHVSNLGDDYYEFNQELLTLSGRHTGESIRLGDRIVVTVAAADIELGRVDFMRQGQSRRSKKGRSRQPLRSKKG